MPANPSLRCFQNKLEGGAGGGDLRGAREPLGGPAGTQRCGPRTGPSERTGHPARTGPVTARPAPAAWRPGQSTAPRPAARLTPWTHTQPGSRPVFLLPRLPQVAGPLPWRRRRRQTPRGTRRGYLGTAPEGDPAGARTRGGGSSGRSRGIRRARAQWSPACAFQVTPDAPHPRAHLGTHVDPCSRRELHQARGPHGATDTTATETVARALVDVPSGRLPGVRHSRAQNPPAPTQAGLGGEPPPPQWTAPPPFPVAPPLSRVDPWALTPTQLSANHA